jgi:hypothetical protein
MSAFQEGGLQMSARAFVELLFPTVVCLVALPLLVLVRFDTQPSVGG